MTPELGNQLIQLVGLLAAAAMGYILTRYGWRPPGSAHSITTPSVPPASVTTAPPAAQATIISQEQLKEIVNQVLAAVLDELKKRGGASGNPVVSQEQVIERVLAIVLAEMRQLALGVQGGMTPIAAQAMNEGKPIVAPVVSQPAGPMILHVVPPPPPASVS